MVTLMLTEEERLLLVDLLECEIDELRGEIRETDRWEYREMLKDREQVIRRLRKELALQVPETLTT